MSLGHSISQPFENEEMDLKLSRVFHAIFTMFMGIKLYNLNCLHEEQKKKKAALVLMVNRNSWIPDSWVSCIVFGYAMTCNVEIRTQDWSSLE